MHVEYLDHMGTDLTVSNSARVSMGKWKERLDTADKKLIEYLARHSHWTPFAETAIQLRITVPIFVARQAFRSTVGTVRNEVSKRYCDDAPEFFIPSEWRSRPEKSIKQGSGAALDGAVQENVKTVYKNFLSIASDAYALLLERGVAPEQARMVLPQSMYTSWVETGSLAYWWRFYSLRSDSHAQKEIQDLAALIKEQVQPLFPVCWKALEESA